jgi:hypothetical protein
MVVANQVYQDVASRSFVIAGTFNCVKFRQKPPEFSSQPSTQVNQPREMSIGELRMAGSPWLFFSITGIVEAVECSVRYVFLQDNQVLFCSKEFMVESSDRLKTIEQAIPLPVLPIHGADHYALEFFAGHEMIGSLRILAIPDEPADEQEK